MEHSKKHFMSRRGFASAALVAPPWLERLAYASRGLRRGERHR